MIKAGGAAVAHELPHGGQGGEKDRVPVEILPYLVEGFEPVEELHALDLAEAPGEILIQVMMGVDEAGIEEHPGAVEGLIRHLVLGADPLDQPVPEPNVRIPVHPIRPVAGNHGVHVLQQRAHSPTSLYGQYTMIPPVDFRLVLWAGPWYNEIVLEERK